MLLLVLEVVVEVLVDDVELEDVVVLVVVVVVDVLVLVLEVVVEPFPTFLRQRVPCEVLPSVSSVCAVCRLILLGQLASC